MAQKALSGDERVVKIRIGDAFAGLDAAFPFPALCKLYKGPLNGVNAKVIQLVQL